MGVHKEAEDFDFSSDFFLHVHLLDLLAIEDFDGDLVTCQDMFCNFDLPKRSYA